MQITKCAVAFFRSCATASAFAFAAVGLGMTAKGDDVRRHCVLDWSVKAPADAAKISQGDLYDRLRYSTGATPFTYSSIYDSTSSFTLPDGTECTPDPVKVVTDETVNFATLRTSRVVPFVRFTQPRYTDQSGSVYVRSQKIALPSSQVSATVSNEISIVMRIRWDGFVAGKNWAQVFGYGWKWQAGKGVCAYLGNHSSSMKAYPALTIGSNTITLKSDDLVVCSNHWYDIAYTMKQVADGDTLNTVVTAYACCLPESNGKRNWIMSCCVTNTTIAAISFTGDRNWISCQDSEALKSITADERHFRGDIQRIAVYSKELNADEVRQAFTGESEEVSLGVRNSSADEFSDSAGCEFNADTMAWHEFRKSLTAEKPYVVIRKKLDPRWAARAHVLKFGVLPDANRSSPVANLKISVNGTRVGRVKLGPDGSDFRVCLPSGLMENVLNESDDYLMSLKIERDERADFGGDVEFDYLTVGGPWQIGIEDRENGELGDVGGGKGDLLRYHVAAWDDTKCGNATFTDPSSGAYVFAPQKIYFTLTEDMAADLDFTFSYRSISYNANWKLVVNGVDYDTQFYTDKTATSSRTYSWTFPKGTFKDGINCLELAVPSGEGLDQWNHHDMFSFSVADFYPGSLCTEPLNFGVKMIFQ